MNVTIESPKGSTRSGTSKDGKRWERLVHADYGYIRGTEGNDGDHVDIHIGPHPDVELIYVIDQVDPKTQRFDEHKAVAGTRSLREAKELYLANYPKGWKGLGAITPLTIHQFKEWLNSGTTRKPLSSQVVTIKSAGDYEEPKPPVIVIKRQFAIQIIAP